jgi:hypothetical protein
MCAGDSNFAILRKGLEYIETLVTIIADKVIGGHTHILMESAFGGESGFQH